MAFDQATGQMILFGGQTSSGVLNDTWSWNGEDWTQLDDSGPSARSGHAVVFDSARGHAVLFAGESAAGVLNGTWEWDGGRWAQMAAER